MTHLVPGDTGTRAGFEDEPATYRWIFHRAGGNVAIQILELPGFRHPDRDGTQIRASRPPLDTLPGQ